MSAVKHEGSWRRISDVYHKSGGAWASISAIHARSEGLWYEIDTEAEPQGPAHHVWFIYATNPNEPDFASKGISDDPAGKLWLGIVSGKRKATYDLTTDFPDNASLADVKWLKVPEVTDGFSFINAPNGNTIKNGNGTLTLSISTIQSGVLSTMPNDTVDPQLYVGGTAYGRQPSFTAADINERLLVELKDNGAVLDTINLIDLQDGSSATQVGFTADNVLAFVQEKNDGAWNTLNYSTTMTFTFYRSGGTVATRTATVTLDPATGLLATNVPAAAGGEEITDVTVVNDGSQSVTVVATHTDSGASYSETIVSVKGGDQGDKGDTLVTFLDVANGFAFKNNTGDNKAITAHVYVNGVLVTDTTGFTYHWQINGVDAYVDIDGNLVGTNGGSGRYLADGDANLGLNFQSIVVDPFDVPDNGFLGITCEVNNI